MTSLNQLIFQYEISQFVHFFLPWVQTFFLVDCHQPLVILFSSLAARCRFWDENKITGYNFSCLERKPDDKRFWPQCNLLQMIKGCPVLDLISLETVLAWKDNVVLWLLIAAWPVVEKNSWDVYLVQTSARILHYDNRLFYYCAWNRTLKYEFIFKWRM